MDAVSEVERWNAVKPNRLGKGRKGNPAEREPISPGMQIIPNLAYAMAGTQVRVAWPGRDDAACSDRRRPAARGSQLGNFSLSEGSRRLTLLGKDGHRGVPHEKWSRAVNTGDHPGCVDRGPG